MGKEENPEAGFGGVARLLAQQFKKRKKDPNAPKRNMSAYFLYSVHIRPTVKEENPSASFGEIARIISAQFKELSPKERAGWDEKAAADKERYQREMAEYHG